MRDGVRFRLVGLLPSPIRRRWMARRYERDVVATGEPELRQLRNLVKRGDLAVDVGCNVGDYAFELGRLTGRVVAFEPNPYVYRFVKGLRLAGVDLRQIALADTAGTARLAVPARVGGHGLGSLRDTSGEDQQLDHFEVRTERLDALGLDKVAFVKIDVEGFEEAVLSGAEQTIARDRPALLIEIEERHNAGGLSRIRERLQHAGYSGWFLRGDAWQSIGRFDPATDQQSDAMLAAAGRRRDEVGYVNNFLFLSDGHMPPGHA